MRRLVLLLAIGLGAPASAQRVEARIGVMASTTVVRVEAGSRALERALGNITTDVTELTLRPAPVASVLVVTDITERTALEGSASAGLTQLRASNAEAKWAGQSLTMAALGVGLRYQPRPAWSLNGGVGVTRFFSDSRGIFSQGTTVNPMLEGGVLYRLPVRNLPIHISARAQSQRFGTAALRREGASDGNTTRFLMQLGIGR